MRTTKTPWKSGLTLSLQLISEPEGKRYIGDELVNFPFSDCAFDHYSLIKQFILELTKDENHTWGTDMGDGKEGERIFDSLKKYFVQFEGCTVNPKTGKKHSLKTGKEIL